MKQIFLPWREIAVDDFDQVEQCTIGLWVYIHHRQDDKGTNRLGHHHRVELSGWGTTPNLVKSLILNIPGIEGGVPNCVSNSKVPW